MIIVATMIKMNKLLLKNPSKTFLSSFFNFLQLISLKIYIQTKIWKNKVKWYPFSISNGSFSAELGTLNKVGPMNKTTTNTEI